jgi:hypothetical protein
MAINIKLIVVENRIPLCKDNEILGRGVYAPLRPSVIKMGELFPLATSTIYKPLIQTAIISLIVMAVEAYCYAI